MCLENPRINLAIIFAMLILAIGCSGGESSPVAPVESMEDPLTEREQNSERTLWGIWEIRIDPFEMSVEIEPARTVLAHFEVTDFVLPPSCDDCFSISVNGFDTVSRILDADVTLRNPMPIAGRDVRGILFTNQYGHVITNADGWTELWDIPNGEDINPFKGFAKSVATRVFEGGAEHSENYLVYIPQPPQYWAIQFAVDASWPGNCKEPYSIENFLQDGELFSITGSMVDIQVDVFDWQDDVNEVSIAVPEITGEGLIPLIDVGGNTWEATIANDTGAGVGDYDALIAATSTNDGSLAIFDYVSIEITEAPYPVVTGIIPDLADPGDDLPGVEVFGENFSGPDALVKLRKDDEPDIEAENVVVVDENNITCDINIPLDAATGLYDVEVTSGSGFSGSGSGLFHVLGPTPENPVNITPPWLNFSPREICLEGDYLYVAGSTNGMHIFNISDSLNPTWVSKVELPWESLVIDAGGDCVCVGRSWSPYSEPIMHVVDVSDPYNPYVANSLDMNSCSDIAIQGEYAFVADGSDGFKVVDIDPPESASVVHTIEGFSACEIGLTDDYAYIRTYPSGLVRIVDISDPLTAFVIDSFEIADGLEYFGVDYPYLGAVIRFGEPMHIWYELRAYDISSPTEPVYIGGGGNWSSMSRFYLGGDRAYVAHGDDTDVYDLSSGVDHLYEFELEQEVAGMDSADELAYFATYYSGINVVDISGSDSAQVISSVYTPCSSEKLLITDVYAFAGGRNTGTQVYDISPVNLAHSLGLIDHWPSYDMSVNGNTLFIDSIAKLKVYDITSIQSPVLINSINASGFELFVTDEYAYMAGSSQGMQVVDINPIESAEVVKIIEPITNANEIWVADDYAYLAKGSTGLMIVDLEPLDDAHVYKIIDTPDIAEDLAIFNGYAFIADRGGTLEIIDIDPVEDSSIVLSVPLSGNGLTVDISGGYAYVATEYDTRVDILDIGIPESAFIELSIELPNEYLPTSFVRPEDIKVVDNYLYLLRGKQGLLIYQLWE